MRQRKNLKIMMADHVPFDIQTIIIKKLPVKSVIRFRCVSKQWKSFINSSEFIQNYQTVSDCHLLVQKFIAHKNKYVSIDEYVSINDNDTFPEHMSPIIVPLSVKSLENVRILGSSYGIICFHGYHKGYLELFVFWNPSIRKSVSVSLPPVQYRTSWVGFGVCPKSCDPKLVKIEDIKGIPEVQVYTLSTRAWKKLSLKPPYKPFGLRYSELGVCVKGFIYWLACDERPPPVKDGSSNSIVSFDLSNDEFGKMYLPNSFLHSEDLRLSKWNECLIMYEYSDICGHSLNYLDVWVMKDDGGTPSFNVMFRIESIFPKYCILLELRKNGEAIIESRYANDDHDIDPVIQVYDPCSRRVNDIRIPWSGHDDIGKTASLFSVSSYTETLLLLGHDSNTAKYRD